MYIKYTIISQSIQFLKENNNREKEVKYKFTIKSISKGNKLIKDSNNSLANSTWIYSQL
jgi:hypothetical protein